MAHPLRSTILQHPEQIHPSLWRGSQLSRPYSEVVSTGYPMLDTHLPGGGWPIGSLIEIMTARPGMGEIQLLKPALNTLESGRSVALVNTPYIPSSFCLKQWFADKYRVLWIRPQTSGNTLWAIEKILQHNACAALLCWIDDAQPSALRRLHVAARQSTTLFFSLRPVSAATQPSIAPLRLSLKPSAFGLDVNLLKRRGPVLQTNIPLFLRHPDLVAPTPNHDTLDQYHPSLSRAGQQLASMAG